MKINANENITAYTSFGFDIFHAGIIPFGIKGVLGLPSHFQFDNLYEFNTQGVQVSYFFDAFIQLIYLSKPCQHASPNLALKTMGKH